MLIATMTDPVLLTHLRTYWLCGFAGGILHDLLVHHGCLTMPRYSRERAELNLGTLGSAAIGIGAAILADNSPIVAFSAAIIGATALREGVRCYGEFAGRRKARDLGPGGG